MTHREADRTGIWVGRDKELSGDREDESRKSLWYPEGSWGAGQQLGDRNGEA